MKKTLPVETFGTNTVGKTVSKHTPVCFSEHTYVNMQYTHI